MLGAPRVIIVGAGLAGLACARHLTQHGVACTLLESSDAPGGRVRTDRVDGFLLDRGFQVFLTGYPEARRVLDFRGLRLSLFHPGAQVRYAGRFHRMSDPLRRPQDVLHTLFNPIGSLADKIKVLRLRLDAVAGRVCLKEGRESRPTSEILAAYGFSDRMLARFFRPFLGGVFLEPQLRTPCWVFETVWAAFSRGAIALPKEGMEAVARQLAHGLPAHSIRLHASVVAIDGTTALLTTGERLDATALILATDYATAARLCGEAVPTAMARESLTLYFDAPGPPLRGPWLILNGEGTGSVRTLCVLSEVAPSYAPGGRSLISVSVRDERCEAGQSLQENVRHELRGWFGSSVDRWRHLRTDRVAAALPPIEVLPRLTAAGVQSVRPGLYRCGDYLESATLEGALLSGRKAAERAILDLNLRSSP